MRAIGIILAGGNSYRMKELSRKRAVCAMPIAGSYRSIDFALSNMTNSHIQKVAVFTQYNARSLNEHLNSSKWWDFGRKQGGLYVFTPAVTAESNFWYRGTADAIAQNLSFLKSSHEPYVVIASGDGVYKLDYNKVLEYHIEKKADITVVCKDMPEDAERRGIGTPATRAAILEKLVTSGLVERKKAKKITNLLPTQAGSSLVTVLPEALQSPLLTAEWEQRLGEVERGTLAPEDFMDGITALVHDLVRDYQPVSGWEVLFPPDREAVGPCPRCGGAVTESKKGFFCENRDCRFVLWKDSKFFSAKKKQLTKSIAASLLKDGRVKLTGCFSEKTGKTYDATAVLEDDGTKTNYKLVFDNG